MLQTFGFTIKAAFLIGVLQCVTGMGNTVYHVSLTRDAITPEAIGWGAISLLNSDCSVCDGVCGRQCDLTGQANRSQMMFESFTLDRICQAFRSPDTYGENDLRFSDLTCLLAPVYFKKDDNVNAKYNNGRWYSATIKADNGDDTYRIEYDDDGVVTTHQRADDIKGYYSHDVFVPITEMPLVHKYVHRIYHNDGGCRCGQHASKWCCTHPLRDHAHESLCRSLRMQAFTREEEVGSTFDEKLHDLKTEITILRNEDYWNFYRNHPAEAVYFEQTSDESESTSATEDPDAKCPLCLYDTLPEHTERTPCCAQIMHRHCLKSHIETAVDEEAAFIGADPNPHVCPMCKANWDEDAPLILEHYRNFVQVLETTELSPEELAMQQQDDWRELMGVQL
jgi:hypothetical protein